MKLIENMVHALKKVFTVFEAIKLRYCMYKRAAVVRSRAEHGDAVAQAILGVMYSQGISVPRDNVTALEWYLKSAIQGNSSAQLIIGIRYAVGNGVMRNSTEAIRWYSKAASQNSIEAQMALGVMYIYGTGGHYDI